MRLNQYIAHASGLSRRAADKAVQNGQVTVDGQTAQPGQEVSEANIVVLDQRRLQLPATQTIILNKPVGYVCSRDGQGSKTIYDLLPPELHNLKPAGRLDKDSSGLLLLTNDGQLAHELTHPKFIKQKIYEVELSKPLTAQDWRLITIPGVKLEDGHSKLELKQLDKNDGRKLVVRMHEGRNRQIRRTFAALGYSVKSLRRTQLSGYTLSGLELGNYRPI